MKITLLFTVLGVAANTASALEIPQFLRGIAVEAQTCHCKNDNDCNGGDFCNTDKNCKIDGNHIGTCQPGGGGSNRRTCNKDSQCSNNEYCDKPSGYCINDNARSAVDCVRDNDCDRSRDERCDSNGRCVYNGGNNRGNCNNNSQCNGNQYCTSSGFCREDNRNNWACNYKQCTNKGNQDLCECSWDEACTKGNERGANTCNHDGDLNGCCVPDLQARAGLFVQDSHQEHDEGEAGLYVNDEYDE